MSDIVTASPDVSPEDAALRAKRASEICAMLFSAIPWEADPVAAADAALGLYLTVALMYFDPESVRQTLMSVVTNLPEMTRRYAALVGREEGRA
jgi:hypothetical protein